MCRIKIREMKTDGTIERIVEETVRRVVYEHLQAQDISNMIHEADVANAVAKAVANTVIEKIDNIINKH